MRKSTAEKREVQEREDLDNIKTIADVTYGEAASEGRDVKIMVASTIVNRYLDQREEFGLTFRDIAQKGYYACKNRNEPYTEADTGTFKTYQGYLSYLECYEIACIIYRFTLREGKEILVGGHFYFTATEEERLKNEGTFQFTDVVPIYSVGSYHVFRYV